MSSEKANRYNFRKLLSDNKGNLLVVEKAMKAWMVNFLSKNFSQLSVNTDQIHYSDFNSDACFQVNIDLSHLKLKHDLIQKIQYELLYEINHKFRINVLSVNIIQNL